MKKRIDNFGAVGLNSDIAPSLLPENAFTHVENIIATEASVRSTRGESRLLDLEVSSGDWIEPVYHTTYTDSAQGNWIIVSDGSRVVAFSLSGDIQEITPTVDGESGSAKDLFIPSFVSMTSLNGVLVINSELSGPFYWPGPGAPANPLQPLPGPGDSVRGWLSGSGVPASGTGDDGDYYKDTDNDTWYVKVSGAWVLTSSVGGTVEYGWNWNEQWRCKFMESYKYYLVAVGMAENELNFFSLVRWSDATEEGAVPIEWFPRTSNAAGYDTIGETPGVLVSAVRVRDSLFLIKEDSIFLMRWIGGQYVMSITRLQGTIGTSIPLGCAEMQGTVLIFTSSDLLVFDGQQQFSITDNRVKNSIFSGLSSESWARSRIFYFEPDNTLYIALSKVGGQSLSDAQVYDSIKKVWGHKSLSASYGFDAISDIIASSGGSYTGEPTWDEMGGAPPPNPSYNGWQIGVPWDDQIYGGWDTSAYQASTISLLIYESDGASEYWVSTVSGTNTNSDGSAKYCEVSRTGLTFLGMDEYNQINRLWIGFTGNAALSINIGAQIGLDGDTTWAKNKDGTTEFTILPGEEPIIDPVVSGRYITYKISTQEDVNWTLNSITFDIEDAGE